MDTSQPPSDPVEEPEAIKDPLEGLDLDSMSERDILDLIDEAMVLELLRHLKSPDVSLATLEQARKILQAKGHVRTSTKAKAAGNPEIRSALSDVPLETLREQGISIEL